jgi:hypothetical protein
MGKLTLLIILLVINTNLVSLLYLPQEIITFIILLSIVVLLHSVSFYLHDLVYRYRPKPEVKARKSTWPTNALREAIERCSEHIKGESDYIIDWVLEENTEDVTLKGLNETQITDFMPFLRLVGIDLWFERFFPSPFSTWGGVLARVLENSNKETNTKMRCVQYIFIYTRQIGIVSIVWCVLTPILMALWLLIFPEMSSSHCVAVFLPLFFLFLWDYGRMHPSQGIGFRPTSSIILLVLWVLLGVRETNISLVLFNLEIELTVLIYLAIAGVFIFIWFLDRVEVLPTGHEMDYIPVYVYLTYLPGTGIARAINQDLNPEEMDPNILELWNWQFYSIAYDSDHYKMVMKSKDELEYSGKGMGDSAYYLKNSRNVRLLVDNPWHSLRLGEQRLFSNIIPIFSKAIITLAPFIYLIPWYILEENLRLFGYVIYPFLVALACCFLANGLAKILPHAEFLQSWSDDWQHLAVNATDLSNIRYLYDGRTLWNLRGKGRNADKPKLVVVGKLQSPFRYMNSKTFRDTREDLLQEIARLQSKLGIEDSTSGLKEVTIEELYGEIKKLQVRNKMVV